jgi:hypothetical protein
MKRITGSAAALFLLSMTVAAPQAQAQSTPKPTAQPQSSRDATREQLRAVLDATGPGINVAFRQSVKQPYNFSGVLSQGLSNADNFEIVVGVTMDETISFRIFPQYKGRYINLDKAANGPALMRELLRYSDKNFLFWGADQSFDIFAGYNFTLESGFPEAAIRIVLRSIANLDKYVGEMKPVIQ